VTAVTLITSVSNPRIIIIIILPRTTDGHAIETSNPRSQPSMIDVIGDSMGNLSQQAAPCHQHPSNLALYTE
jgi:hypothetical protein